MMPGARFALNIVHPASPVLRIRYRSGVLMDPRGFPDWVLYARALVDLPAAPAGLGRDEVRVLDVLAANLVMAGEDPLWDDTPRTPAGWCWAHLAGERRVALVPIELHAAFRHGGGMRTTTVTSSARGLRGTTVSPVEFGDDGIGDGDNDEVPEEIVEDLETMLGYRLPADYREFVLATNGAAPTSPGVLPGFGFLADQPLFGIARTDPMQDLAVVPPFFTDRLPPDFLPIGYVQGGVLAIGIAPPVMGSVWYLDDDDPRDRDDYGPAEIRAQLLQPCAESFADFRARLVRPPDHLLGEAEVWFLRGDARPVRDDDAGAGLPTAVRAPWQPAPVGKRDRVTGLFDTSRSRPTTNGRVSG